MSTKIRREVSFGRQGETVEIVVQDPIQGQLLVETSKRARNKRALHHKLVKLATLLNDAPDANGRLVLIDPVLKEGYITDVWKEVAGVLDQSIASRLTLSILRDGRTTVGKSLLFQEDLEDELHDEQEKQQTTKIRMPRSQHKYSIQKVLISRWIRNDGFISAKDLSAIAGSSYPTVKKAIDELDRYLERGPKNSFRLSRFPWEAYQEMRALGSDARFTLHYKDVSGRPRALASYVERLAEIDFEDAAIGGAPGARHWWPKLDLIGTPRLDISVHTQDDYLDVRFVRELDPALKQTEDSPHQASVVVHAVRRSESMFERTTSPLPIADPVECLLDLSEMGFEGQVTEWIDSIKWERTNARPSA